MGWKSKNGKSFEIYIGCPSPSYKAVLDVISSLILPGNDADGPLRASLKMLCIWVWTRRICKYAHKQIHKWKYAMVKCGFFGYSCFECYDAEEVHPLSLGCILPGSAWLFTDVLTLSGNDALWGLSHRGLNRIWTWNALKKYEIVKYLACDFRICY